MSLARDIAFALPELRAQAESLMVDGCVIGFETKSTVIDEQTGLYPDVIAEPVYTGPCELMDARAALQEVEAAGQLLIEQGSILKLPVDGSAGVLKDMVVRFTSAKFDGEHIGLKLRVTGPFHKSTAVSRRFLVQEIQ